MNGRLRKTIFGLSALLGIELLIAFRSCSTGRETATSSFERAVASERLAHEQDKGRLATESQERKYLATGRTALDRVYNRADQTIDQLIEGLAREALPEGWKSRVRVEEFTHFLLLVQVDATRDFADTRLVIDRLRPLMAFAVPYLRSAAVFDRKYRCFLFLDEQAIGTLARGEPFGLPDISRAKELGQGFRRFNSSEIRLRNVEGHMLVMAEISGEGGIVEAPMLLDTGASASMISWKLAGKTGGEELADAPTRTFYTPKGPMQCAMVIRTLRVGQTERTLEIAVAPTEDLDLLGVDFLKGYDYIIDSAEETIYLWPQGK